MRLVRFGDFGSEKPGILTSEGFIFDVSEFCSDFDETFFASNGIEDLGKWFFQKRKFLPLVSDEVRLGAPVAGPSKLISVRSNRAEVPVQSDNAKPAIFFKSTTAIVGAGDHIIIPRNIERIHWEVELAVIIGKEASHVDEKAAMSCVAGYCMHTNYAATLFHMERRGEWGKADESNAFSPLGPYLVTPDEVDNINNLYVWLKVNGRLVQIGNTSTMIFSVPFLISYVSHFTTLLPGDVISTVAAQCQGPGIVSHLHLKSGDAVELSIEKLGYAKQHILKWEETANHKFLEHVPSRAFLKCENY